MARLTEKSGFFVLGDTVRGFWIGWDGYPGEEFDAEREADNELTWQELAHTKYLDKFWDSYSGESVTAEGIDEFWNWLRDSGAPSEVASRLSLRLREEL